MKNMIGLTAVCYVFACCCGMILGIRGAKTDINSQNEKI
jgi:hypothetical protein